MDKIMEENQKKIEEQQKKMVRLIYMDVEMNSIDFDFRPRTG